MKLLKPFLTAGLTLSLLQFSAGQDEPEKPREKTDVEIKRDKLNEAFSNLPEEKRTAYLKGRQEAQRLFSKKRTFETLMTIYEIEEIFPNDPAVLNLIGAVHVEFRDFDYARLIFDRAVELAGEDPKILFNVAEIEFCSNNWETCIQKFDYLIKKIDNPDSDFVNIMELKRLLCFLALANENKDNAQKRAEYLNKAKEIAKLHDYMDDTPFSYYANASLAYFEEDKILASEWVMRGKKVFGPANTLSWDDTLVEFGYIESHYGLHFSKANRDAPAAP
mgnify:FL=1